MDDGYTIAQLEDGDFAVLQTLNTVFAEAFEDPETYLGNKPDEEYLESFLQNKSHIVLAAQKDSEVVGGLVAYVLHKFEQRRSEVYLYDLAVALPHRRKGIATGLITALKDAAKERGAYLIYVQADKGDDAAIHLYESLGTASEVIHFDINL